VYLLDFLPRFFGAGFRLAGFDRGFFRSLASLSSSLGSSSSSVDSEFQRGLEMNEFGLIYVLEL
jgi:hypothetical protein